MSLKHFSRFLVILNYVENFAFHQKGYYNSEQSNKYCQKPRCLPNRDYSQKPYYQETGGEETGGWTVSEAVMVSLMMSVSPSQS